ncbi:hypothetical protein [Klebsiella pneumoniae]|nr:hypothetical protein [Klebsiella pneumoniae]
MSESDFSSPYITGYDLAFRRAISGHWQMVEGRSPGSRVIG